MARAPHKLKEKLIEGVSGLRTLADLGVPIHKLKHIKLHGKVMGWQTIARAIVGSINIAPGSFDSRRELAIEVDDDRHHQTDRQDAGARLGELKTARSSDEGLLEDLKNYDPDIVEDLASANIHANKPCVSGPALRN